MCEESKFWISINVVVCATVVAIIFLSTSYWKDHNTKVVQLIGEGVDPVAAMCALQDDYGNLPVCLVLAAKAN